MSLLAPAGLFALCLLPLVVAIHLWRVRHRRYELSSTLLWSHVLMQTPLRRPRHLPTRYVLLALQLAALTCGAVALARPSLADPGGHRHVLIAVDTSLAMAATDVHPSRLAQAKEAIRTLIDGLAGGDSMTLVDVGTDPRVLAAGGDHAALQRALDAVSQGYGPSSLASDGPLLASLVGAATRRDSAYLFAPLGTARATIGVLSRVAQRLNVRLIGTSTDDRGVAGLSVACAGAHCEAYARLVNTAARAVTTRVTAVVDGQQVTQQVTLPAASAAPIGLALPAGSRTVELRIDGHDALPADDAAWAAMPLAVHRTVLLVTDDPTSALPQALHAIPNLTVNTTTPAQYSDDMTRNVDLTVLDTTGPDIQSPGSVLAIDPTGSGGFITTQGTTLSPGVVATRPDDPLLAGVDLSSLVIASATRAPLPAWARVDVQGDGGPLLYSGTVGGRRVAVLTFDPRTTAANNASNLATLLAFPTLLRNSIETLAPGPVTALTAGQQSAVPVARRGIAWIRPIAGSGRAVPLVSSGDLAAVPALRPGLYSFGGAAGGAAQTVAVNAPVPGDPAAPQSVAPAAAPAVPTLAAPAQATPWEGWAILALLALLAMSGEWWYYVRHT